MDKIRILLLASSYNGLCQRAHVELEALGMEVSIALALSAEDILQAVALFEPHLVICPFLKERIPEDVLKRHLCIVIHPGIKGDRGPSSLDWAIMDGCDEWGVTALQAADEMDAGDIWATQTFPMRKASKASLYRREVTQAAMKVILETLKHFQDKDFAPEPLDYAQPNVQGRLRPLMRQHERTINWANDSVATIVTKINAADSSPGVLDTLFGEEYFLFGAHADGQLRGWEPGEIIAKRHGAICRAAVDGAVWISHLRKKKVDKQPFYHRLLRHRERAHNFKLPAALVLGPNVIAVPEDPIDLLYTGSDQTFKEIWYEEANGVGYLYFDFHNGAMSSEQCERLLQAYRLALQRPTKVIVLMGGTDFWSNGIHLNLIEASENPADESWHNINAIDDVVQAILVTETHMTVAAVYGSAGAGGAMMALATDYVWPRAGCIMNPHYKSMGLYGSEYWTYSLPKRVGPGRALELTDVPLPIGMKKAKSIGMIDEMLPDAIDAYLQQLRCRAEDLAANKAFDHLLNEKLNRRWRDEQQKPLAAYRAAELARMRMNFSGKFYGGDIGYHEARYNFVNKIRPKETASYLAKHARLDFARLHELRQPLTY